MQCVLLAGGFGTRLQKIVSDVPKPLAKVDGRPFLLYVMDLLLKNHCSHFVFSLFHKAEQITGFIQQHFKNLSVDFVIEPEPLGTGGALKFALNHTTEKDILIVNADSYVETDLQQMKKFHVQHKADITIAVKEMFDFDRYGLVSFDAQNRIQSFSEKKPEKHGFINAGYMFVNRNLFEHFDKAIFNFERDFLMENMSHLKLMAYPVQKTFIDIGIEEDYALAQHLFKNYTFL